ncbi:MAG: hypothetical protein ACK53Y_03980, partial [bacterium]
AGSGGTRCTGKDCLHPLPRRHPSPRHPKGRRLRAAAAGYAAWRTGLRAPGGPAAAATRPQSARETCAATG